MDNNRAEELILEVRAVKMLLILQLLENEVSQRQIAVMLGISEATMSRMLPKTASKRGPVSGRNAARTAGSTS